MRVLLLVEAGVLEVGDITPQGPHQEKVDGVLQENAEALVACNESGQRQTLTVDLRVDSGAIMLLKVEGPEDLSGCVRGVLKAADWSGLSQQALHFPIELVPPMVGSEPTWSPPAEAQGPGLTVVSVAAKGEQTAERVARLKVDLAAPCYLGTRKGGTVVVSSKRGVLEDGVGDGPAAECLSREVGSWVWPDEAGSDVVITFLVVPQPR